MKTIAASAPSGRARPPGAPRTSIASRPTQRLRVIIRGAVQGVGFRPFVYRLATELTLNGWVLNSAQGVFIEVEGVRDSLQKFLLRLEKGKPQRAIIQSCESSFLDPVGFDNFSIRETDNRGDKSALILPDIATCADCLREIVDLTNRRFRYPFTNCTNCGPRFSIVESLPYDRANTSMNKFAMCPECEREYHDPLDRRFHAQPNACPKCGPQLQFWDANGAAVEDRPDALVQAAEAIRAGKILALKGIGGFQLIVDARNEDAVLRLRERKHREEKPFALMYPSLKAVRANCEISELEERLLTSPESPIVLVERDRSEPDRHLSRGGRIVAGRDRRARRGRLCEPSLPCEAIAPGNPNLGVMLPYTPLHHLLMRDLNFPVVATSGNLSDEPICIDEQEALGRLHGIADFFLIHDRPIVRHVDDSIVRVLCGREMVLRRARGYAPLPISIKSKSEDRKGKTILAVGAHLKNAVALKIDNNIFISQHIGDLETEQAYKAFQRAAHDLPRIYDRKIDLVACDMHPDYLSTEFALNLGLPDESIQHHWAHVAACMAENEIEAPVLGIAWDGTGYGLDGTIWGGEFLLATKDGTFRRVAHLRQFRLPGGDAAIREPRRSALGLLHEIFGKELWKRPELIADLNQSERALWRQMLTKNINAPLTSSAGRLFDAVASLIGLRQRASFEGQAAMDLEFARRPKVRDAYPFRMTNASPLVIDWEPAIHELLADVAHGENSRVISARFHNMLVELIVATAQKMGEPKVVLTGGCFQNRYLTERTVERLQQENFKPYWHQRIPPNDGGIALGQAVAASWKG
jgi:hydrogenase maturation protein HypF